MRYVVEVQTVTCPPAPPLAHGRHVFETLFSHHQPLRTNKGNNRRVPKTPEAPNSSFTRQSTNRQSVKTPDCGKPIRARPPNKRSSRNLSLPCARTALALNFAMLPAVEAPCAPALRDRLGARSLVHRGIFSECLVSVCEVDVCGGYRDSMLSRRGSRCSGLWDR